MTAIAGIDRTLQRDTSGIIIITCVFMWHTSRLKKEHYTQEQTMCNHNGSSALKYIVHISLQTQ